MKVNYSGYTKEEVIKRCQFLDDKITSISEENERLKKNRDRLQVPLKQRNKDLEQAYTVLALKISQYLNGNLSVSAEDIKKEWKRGEQLLKGKSDG